MKLSSFFRPVKKWLDSNESPWTLPLPPWYPARHRQLRGLRQLARRRLRAELISRQGWLVTISQLLAWPFISVLKSILAVRNYHAAWPARCRQMIIYTWLQWAHNLRSADQEDHWLTKPQWRDEVTGYLSCREHQALVSLCTPLKALPDYPQIFTKLAFDEFCARHDLSAAPRLAWGQAGKCEGQQPLPADDLVLKPTSMGRGNGVEILFYDSSTGQWQGALGWRITPENLAAYAQTRLGDHPWLIQPRLRNAATWQPFTPGALATARIVTGRIDPAAAPIVIGGYMRMPRIGAHADNLCQGGIGALMDINTGRMGTGHTYRDCFEDFAFHPDTGTRIAGVEPAGFSDIVALTLRAHTAAGSWSSIGWDVTLTDGGAVLIEANLHWAIIPGMPITRTPYLEMTQSALHRVARLNANA